MERSSPQPLHRPPTPAQLEVARSPAAGWGVIPLSQYHAQVAQVLRSFIPATYLWLSSEDIRLTGIHPIAAGGFADILEATHRGRRVVLKSYRCYIMSDIAHIARRFHNELQVLGLLHKDISTVPFIGVYSTEIHPFGLVYEYMDGFDLRQQLRNKPDVGRMSLLMDIARGLNSVHDLNIVHGGLKTTNVLVDNNGGAYLAGFGNAHILSRPVAGESESSVSAGRYSRGHVLELTGPMLPLDTTDPIRPTKSSDAYDFGVLAFEVLTGRPPFFELAEVAAMYSMLKGDRPPRPNHIEVSDGIWYMIERCWHVVPSERMSIGEVIVLLETELQQAHDL